MDEMKDQEWVIEEDELALENSILQKHHHNIKPKDEKKKEVQFTTPDKKISIRSEPEESPTYLGEKTIIFLLLIISPYLLGTFLFFLLIPLLTDIDIDILFLAIDFFDWVSYFLFWTIGYMVLTFSGFSFLVYKSRH